MHWLFTSILLAGVILSSCRPDKSESQSNGLISTDAPLNILKIIRLYASGDLGGHFCFSETNSPSQVAIWLRQKSCDTYIGNTIILQDGYKYAFKNTKEPVNVLNIKKMDFHSDLIYSIQSPFFRTRPGSVETLGYLKTNYFAKYCGEIRFSTTGIISDVLHCK